MIATLPRAASLARKAPALYAESPRTSMSSGSARSNPGAA